MSAWYLPTSINVMGVDYNIRTDFRIVIDVLIAFANPDYTDYEKILYCIMSLVEDYENLPESAYAEAQKQLADFIDMEQAEDESDKKKAKPRTMDWEQDANLIIPAVNRVVGHEVRAESYMHWWTFLSAYMEIGECSYSHILSIRAKKAKGKKLEKWEQEFVRENKSVVILKTKLSQEEEEEQRLLEEKFG